MHRLFAVLGFSSILLSALGSCSDHPFGPDESNPDTSDTDIKNPDAGITDLNPDISNPPEQTPDSEDRRTSQTDRPAETAESAETAETADEDDTEGELAAEPEEQKGCPYEMAMVSGSHCTNVTQTCKEYVESPIDNPFARCRVFEEPTECKGDRVDMRFCIDILETAGHDGLPLADKSWNQAKSICESLGKRLCSEREWLFACEGEEALPYPYGYVRNPDICNFDKTDGLVTKQGKLADHRMQADANPECVSPFGVQNMVGNIDEWVVLDSPYYSARNNNRKMQSGLKGGWWGPMRSRCRPTTYDHDESYRALQTGVRCCKDAD